VESMSRFLTTNRNIELLEPYEGKLSRTVLRGEGGSNALDLPDEHRIALVKLQKYPNPTQAQTVHTGHLEEQ
ncbi:hypothetical protein ACIXNJ_21035, partial [Bacteroides fragilis]